MMFDLIIM